MEYERRLGLEARRQRRERHPGVAAVGAGVVVGLAVLLGASWMVRPGWQPSRPLRVATPTSAPGHANGGAVVGSIATRVASEVAATVSEPPGPPPAVAKVEDTAGQPARRLPRGTEATRPQDERPAPASTPQPLSTRMGSDHHEVAAHMRVEPLGDGFTRYTVRLHEHDGRAVTGATVSLRGRRPDGAPEEVTLDPEGEAGLYRVVVRFTFAEMRLRIASVGRIQEIPLPDSPG